MTIVPFIKAFELEGVRFVRSCGNRFDYVFERAIEGDEISHRKLLFPAGEFEQERPNVPIVGARFPVGGVAGKRARDKEFPGGDDRRAGGLWRFVGPPTDRSVPEDVRERSIEELGLRIRRRPQGPKRIRAPVAEKNESRKVDRDSPEALSGFDFYPPGSTRHKEDGKVSAGSTPAAEDTRGKPAGVKGQIPEGRGDGRGAQEFVVFAGAVGAGDQDELAVKEL